MLSHQVVSAYQATEGARHIRMEIRDSDLKKEMAKGLVFVKADLHQIKTVPPKVTDIQQFGIGNCYLLSTLSTILERDPAYINKILKINENGDVEVTLYDVEDPNKIFTYVMDPTKIVGRNRFLPLGRNTHSHDAIYMIEKAYAFHHMIVDQNKYTEDQEYIIEALLNNKHNIHKAFAELTSHPKKTLPPSFKNLKLADVESTEKSFAKHRVDHKSGLTSGSSRVAYASLLGVKALRHDLETEIDEDYFFATFLSHIATFNASYLTGEKLPDNINTLLEKKLVDKAKLYLNKIFGDYRSPEAIYFIRCIDFKTSASLVQENRPFFEYIHVLDSARESIKTKFNKYMTLTDVSNVEERAKQKIFHFIDKEIPYKRGLKTHTTSAQDENYEYIKEQLQQGQLVTLSTKEGVGKKMVKNRISKTGEPLSKGLAGSHSYQVENCYERDGRKYVLLRNPWGRYVRDYEYKSKTVGGHKIDVLSAKAKLQIGSFSLFYKVKAKLFQAFGIKGASKRQNPRSFPISNPAVPLAHSQDYYEQNGFFEVEISDVTKRFDSISLTSKKGSVTPVIKPANRSCILAFLRAMISGNTMGMNHVKNFFNAMLLDKSDPQVQLDISAALAIHYKLIGNEELSAKWLAKLGTNWTLEEAVSHLQREYQKDLPDFTHILSSGAVVANQKRS
ncbi:hypothetical protein [Aquicella lusitana]|uniref:Calpain catalytic domain-containing protein n=1 Tax=Aquicella lusitana TaxID=254246 RepID=A0A370GXG8_9COXI|nr:hypothetical protein [Aquicella lusitana]RDI46583.1 hypothetical protein C8D86_105107 [Aquicella lusitana]VVC74247.1 hypothetical protein AQULUS_20120 [Aquicella lusitana]